MIDADAARIIDANLNRAREAGRVMEDYARFVLNDAVLAERLKRLRHELARSAQSHGLDQTIRSRDIIGDVGRELRAEREYDRASSADVAVAAGKRLGEALRAIEEYAKIRDPALARTVEQIRYRGYEAERELAVRVTARERFGGVRLYVLITEQLCSGDWLTTARAALEGGADCLQLREKELPDDQLLDRAGRLVDLCRRRDALCIINDRADVALAAGADGVHLGQEDLPVPVVRRVVGPELMIGLSTHTVDQVEAAADLSPDYIAVGPMFDSPTKPQSRVAGPPTLERALEMTSLPLVAIGGIGADNVSKVAATGCRCVCVCRAVISAGEVTEAARKIRRQLESAGPTAP